MCDPALNDQQCQGDLLKPRPFKGSGNVSLTCETILQGALPLLFSLLQGHLINQEYLSSTNLLLQNSVGVKQIFSSTLCWIMYLYICVCGGEACGGAGRESW